MNLLLVGAGGHAKAVCEAIAAAGDSVVAYADPNPAPWMEAAHIVDDAGADAFDAAAGMVVGIGGIDPDGLRRRLGVLERFLETGRAAPPVVHASASVSPTADLNAGAIVLAGAVVQPDAILGRGAIVNSRALVEHDSSLGAGSHVAPGAMVLGGCTIGACVMIGAAAVILPGSEVPDDTLIPAMSRYPR
jgi:sugar O-acyltransferase (sialic acid O-acetyltransferase NeuD family)